MAEKIYGVDPEGQVTPMKVRSAIIKCFYAAHNKELEPPPNIDLEKNEKQTYCEAIVRKAFKDSGGDFDHPTKESIVKAMNELENFSKNFRNQEIVKKNVGQIMKLVEKL